MRSIRARLRLYVPSDIDEEMREETTKLIDDAAARIEALEAALRKISKLYGNYGYAKDIARAALAPEKDK